MFEYQTNNDDYVRFYNRKKASSLSFFDSQKMLWNNL